MWVLIHLISSINEHGTTFRRSKKKNCTVVIRWNYKLPNWLSDMYTPIYFPLFNRIIDFLNIRFLSCSMTQFGPSSHTAFWQVTSHAALFQLIKLYTNICKFANCVYCYYTGNMLYSAWIHIVQVLIWWAWFCTSMSLQTIDFNRKLTNLEMVKLYSLAMRLQKQEKGATPKNVNMYITQYWTVFKQFTLKLIWPICKKEIMMR